MPNRTKTKLPSIRSKVAVVVCLILLIDTWQFTTYIPDLAAAVTSSNVETFDSYSIIEELAKPKYEGRVPGTDGYEQASQYIRQQFIDLGLEPFGSDYIQTYSTDVGIFNSQPTMTLDGKSLELMKEFKPMGTSDSGKASASKIVAVGKAYPEDIAKLNLNGAIALMDANEKDGRNMGVADRVVELKKKGAVAVLVNPSRYYPIDCYERPLRGNSSGTIAFYLAREVLDSVNYQIGEVINKQVLMETSITRQSSVDAQNIAAIVPGRDTSQTVVISATLDGLGLIPGVGAFPSASMNASGVPGVLSLADYYSHNQPEVNLVFAIIGSETTNRDGGRAFLDYYDKTSSSKMVGFYNLYDLGGKKQSINLWAQATAGSELKESLSGLPELIVGQEQVADTLYNFNNSEVEKRGIPNVFFRGAESLDSINDTASNIDREALDKNIRIIREALERYSNSLIRFNIPASTVKPDPDGTVYVREVDHNMKFVATKYFDIYYEPDWRNIDKLVASIDQVYPEIAWWNYYPADNQRTKVYLTDSYDDEFATAHRQPEAQNKTSGGLQNPENHSVSVCYLPQYRDAEKALGTVYHELNHNLASYKLEQLGYSKWFNTEVQEIQGHVNTSRSVPDEKNKFQTELSTTLAQPLSSITWNSYSTKLESGKELGSTYDQTASLIFYIYTVYSPDKAREFTYRMYTENGKPLQDITKETLDTDFNVVLEGWYAWYHDQSIESPSFKQTVYVPGQENDVSSQEVWAGDLIQNRQLSSSDLVITSLKGERVGNDVLFALEYQTGKTRQYSFFNPPQGDKIKYIGSTKLVPGGKSLQFKIGVDDLQDLTAITMMFFAQGQDERNLVIINIPHLKTLLGNELQPATPQSVGNNGIRMGGANRYETSSLIARTMSPDTVDTVILATGKDWSDALLASTLSQKHEAPILLVDNTPARSQAAIDYIDTHLTSSGQVIIVGDTVKISSSFEDTLTKMGVAKTNIRRLAGSTRADTAVNVAKYLNQPSGGTVIIATDKDYADALSISSYAAIKQAPILLVAKDTIPTATWSYLQASKPTKIIIVGGTGVIDQSVETRLKTLTPNVERYGGKDRYETSRQILTGLYQSPDHLTFAYGGNYPDALSGSAYAAAKDAPVLLIPTNLDSKTKSVLAGYKGIEYSLFGGNGVISNNTANEIKRALEE